MICVVENVQCIDRYKLQLHLGIYLLLHHCQMHPFRGRIINRLIEKKIIYQVLSFGRPCIYLSILLKYETHSVCRLSVCAKITQKSRDYINCTTGTRSEASEGPTSITKIEMFSVCLSVCVDCPSVTLISTAQRERVAKRGTH